MARYILIDNDSGCIFGDSADLDGQVFSGSPTDFARALDASIGEHGRDYEMAGYRPRDTSTGYHVYRADINGTEAVPVVHDGQDQDTIDAVERGCEYVGFIHARRD